MVAHDRSGICRRTRFYAEYGGLKFMLALNGKDLANNYYLERKSLPIGWIDISPVFLDKDFQRC